MASGDDDANCDGEATMCRAWWYKYSTTQKLIIYNWLDIASIIFWTGTISLLERYWEILNLESGDIKIIQIARLIAGSMCIGCNWFQCNQCTKKSCGINCGYDRKHTRKKNNIKQHVLFVVCYGAEKHRRSGERNKHHERASSLDHVHSPTNRENKHVTVHNLTLNQRQKNAMLNMNMNPAILT